MSLSLEVALARVGRDEVLARYVEFVAARCRPNTVLATVSDLKVFFAVIDKDPVEVTPADVFIHHRPASRCRDGRVVRLADGGSGMAAHDPPPVGVRVGVVQLARDVRRPCRRTCATADGNTPHGAGGQATGALLIRTLSTLPEKSVGPGRCGSVAGGGSPVADRAMLEAMVLGGCAAGEVIGLRMKDLQPTNRRVFIADGKCGHQRLILMSGQFFQSLSNYPSLERPVDTTTDAVFVVLKTNRRGAC
ncbi:MAG: hypothetical protein U0Q03_20445 [Acidimicrobiales bacterium]